MKMQARLDERRSVVLWRARSAAWPARAGSAADRLQEGRARGRRRTNMQLAIEYMRLNKLAEARDCIERALERGSRQRRTCR